MAPFTISALHDRVTRNGRASVLRCVDFDSVDALRVECQRRPSPTLVLARASDLEQIVDWLGEPHDVCLADAPQALIEYRLRRLAAPIPGAHDPLTGLLSRQSIARAVEVLSTEVEVHTSLSVVFCDVDHFKRLNDTHGHSVGDDVLRGLAELFTSACGANDLVARHGGEEFAILSERDRDSAAGLSERLRRLIDEKYKGDLDVTISCGIATGSREDVEQLFAQADEALYAAKAGGRNRSVHFDELQTASDLSGQDTGIIGLENRARVLSERVANFITLRSRSLVKQVRDEADTDGLTQFYTRRYLDRRLAREADDADRMMSIALVDLDHFGQVNKTHGWPSGDKILREVCEEIRLAIRDTDWVGRYGGEEFCVVMPDTPLEDAITILERLRHSVANAEFLSTTGQRVEMTLSIGAIHTLGRDNHVEMLERASQQALRAKRSGRNRVCA